MSLEEALYTKLSGTSALTAYCGTRIYPNVLPENVTFPAVSYQLIASEHLHHVDGVSTLKSALVQIDCRAASYSVVTAMARAITAALDGLRGTVGTLDVQGIFHEDEQDLPEPDLGVLRRVLEFNIHFVE